MSKKEAYITVTELNNLVKDTLTNTFTTGIKLKGEISNIKTSGVNTYLTLKDEKSSINVVAWNSKFDNLKNGDDVIASGKLTCFTKSGSYQLTAIKIDRIGEGLLHETYEKNKKSFEKKGYFSKSQNIVPLPKQINRLAILTASEGAALQDILYVLKSNSFCGEILVKNCSVQGTQCPKSVSDGIEYFNELHKKKQIDALIIARGGGSFEDLIGYSSKEIVKAIHKTNIYTISAIGHEIDNMLSDFSANVRVPTPSVAGEIISSSKKKEREIMKSNIENMFRLKHHIKNVLISYVQKLEVSKKMLDSINPISFINNETDKLLRTKLYIQNKVLTNINNLTGTIEKYKIKNDSYDPSKIFENGYVAIVDENNNLINRSSEFQDKIRSKQKLKIVFVDGEFDLPIKVNKDVKK